MFENYSCGLTTRSAFNAKLKRGRASCLATCNYSCLTLLITTERQHLSGSQVGETLNDSRGTRSHRLPVSSSRQRDSYTVCPLPCISERYLRMVAERMNSYQRHLGDVARTRFHGNCRSPLPFRCGNERRVI